MIKLVAAMRYGFRMCTTVRELFIVRAGGGFSEAPVMIQTAETRSNGAKLRLTMSKSRRYRRGLF